MQVTRDGRTIHIKNNMTPEQLDAFVRKQQQELPRTIARLREELRTTLAPFDPLHIIAATWYLAHVHEELGYDKVSGVIEYISLLVSERPTTGSFDPYAQQDLVEALYGQLPKAWEIVDASIAMRVLRDASKEGPEADLAGRRFMAGLGMRSARFWHQDDAMVRELFDDPQLVAAIEAKLGFAPIDALAVASHVADRLPEAISSAQARAVDEHPKLMDALRRDDKSDPIVQQLSVLPMAKRPAMAEHCLQIWACLGSVIDTTFRIDKLAQACGIAPERVRAIVDALSITPPITAQKTPAASQASPLDTKPFVSAGDVFVVGAPGQVTTCVRGVLEAALKGTADWNRYDHHRAAWLEARATELLDTALRPELVLRGAVYSFVDEDGATINGEGDAMLLVGNALILLEAKAGNADARGRIGADIRDLLEAAAQQAQRTMDAITRGATFVTADGDEIPASRFADVEHVFPIAVTIENLQWVAPEVAKAIDAGLVTRTVELPWAINVADLEIVCDLMQLPCELLHYLRERRVATEDDYLEINDELDATIAYLEEGLVQLRKGKPADAHVSLVGFFEHVQQYVLDEQAGVADGAPRPSHRIPDVARDELAQLDADRPAGFLDQSFVLLDEVKYSS